MSVMAHGTRAVAVLRNIGADSDTRPWVVACQMCKPGLFGLNFGGAASAVSTIAWAPDWHGAQGWAVIHAAEHEATRCGTCGHLPAKTIDTPTDAVRRAKTEPAATEGQA